MRNAFWVIAALTLFRLGVLVFSQTPIHGDEAQYWTWAKDLDFGYYSKPPMIGWVIAGSTALFGDGAFGVRALSPLLQGGTALIVMMIGTHAFTARIGALSGLTYALLPGVSWASTLISTDTPLLFFIALSTLLYLRGQMLGTGLGLGLGFLSKYAMSYWLIGAALDQAFRKDRLSMRSLLIILALGLLVLTPNIIWNAGQDFVTVTHLGENASLSSERGGLKGLLDFWGSQFGVFGPLTLLALIGALASPTTWRNPATRSLALLALPPLAVVTAQAVLSRANANWAAAAFVPAVPLMVYWVCQIPKLRFVLPVSFGLHGLVVALIAVVVIAPSALPLRQVEKAQTKLMVGPDLGALLADHTGLPIITDDRMSTALILYYGRNLPLPPVHRLPHPKGAVTDHYQMTRPYDACAYEGPRLLLGRHYKTLKDHTALSETRDVIAGRFTYHLTTLVPDDGSC